VTDKPDVMHLVLATANPDKAAEISEILGAHGIVLSPRPAEVPDVEETGETLVENARLKARAICEATKRAAVADDTGLEVVGLGGAPGVYSARYAGEDATYSDNVTKLLSELELIPGADRRARFIAVAFVRFPDSTEIWADGFVDGQISQVARGNGGFGYDPVFVPDEGDGRTFAEMTRAEKHAFSHRGRAFASLAAKLAPRSR
jgi:XTP/dITP diphosphohydrolase